MDKIKRHFQSKGFKRRWKNIYLPAIKVAIAYIWNKIRDKQYIKELEQRRGRDVIESKDDAPAGTVSPVQGKVYSYEDAVEILKKNLIEVEQQYLGKCVTHTITNAVKWVTRQIYGVPVALSEDDIYIDRETKDIGIDAGMYPDRAIPRVAKKGIALRGVVPVAKTTADLLKNTRDNHPDEKLAPVRLKIIKSHRAYWGNDFEILWRVVMAEAQKGLRVMQISIKSYAGWWNGDIPNPRPTDRILGAHSLLIVTLPFMFNGKRALFALDSSYNSGRVWRIGRGVRIMTEDAWRVAGMSFRVIEYTPEIETLLRGKLPEVDNVVLGFDPYALRPVKSAKVGGRRSEAVRTLQKALLFVLGKGKLFEPTTYYGVYTASLVRAFHEKYWKRFEPYGWNWDGSGGKRSLRDLNGQYAGELTIKILREVIKEMT